MNLRDQIPEAAGKRNVLVDSNLLVLRVVGRVDRIRIASFKRTSKYTPLDFRFLEKLLSEFADLYAPSHGFAEVSNLIDLEGEQRNVARKLLREDIARWIEPAVPSRTACEHELYVSLGLTDAAIAVIARDHNCFVLTDDLPLYVRLGGLGIAVANYTHLRLRFRLL